MGSRRGASLQKNGTPGIVRVKAESSIAKTARQRRRSIGGVSTKSIVSADVSSTRAENCMTGASRPQESTTGKSDVNSSRSDWQSSPPSPVQGLCPQLYSLGGRGPIEIVTEISSRETAKLLEPLTKLKLQLFPMDEATREGLEKDKCNPHLELTLRAQKKISSVLKHLNSKWGSSSIALGKLMLFPYNIERENLANYRRWTVKDTDISAADVYECIGSPAIFRLRYGWFSNLENKASNVPLKSLSLENHGQSEDSHKVCAHPEIISGDEQPSQKHTPTSLSDPSNEDVARPIPSHQEGNLRMDNDTAVLSSGLWTDNLSNISFRDMYLRAYATEDISHCDPMCAERNLGPQQIPFICDSFDAAIAAVISGREGSGPSTTTASHTSILDAEETCHAFPFTNTSTSLIREVPASSVASFRSCSQNLGLDSVRSPDSIEVKPQEGITQTGHLFQETRGPSQTHIQDLDNVEYDCGMTSMCWPNSLGPLDLGLSSSKNITSGDSMDFSSLVASSLDAFQNCLFFGKESNPKVLHEAPKASTVPAD